MERSKRFGVPGHPNGGKGPLPDRKPACSMPSSAPPVCSPNPGRKEIAWVKCPIKSKARANWPGRFPLSRRSARRPGAEKFYGLSFVLARVLPSIIERTCLKSLIQRRRKLGANTKTLHDCWRPKSSPRPIRLGLGLWNPFSGWAGHDASRPGGPQTAQHRNNYSTWFDAETMEPTHYHAAGRSGSLLLLVEAAKTNAAESLKCDPAAVRLAFGEGKCGMAITWPTAW